MIEVHGLGLLQPVPIAPGRWQNDARPPYRIVAMHILELAVPIAAACRDVTAELPSPGAEATGPRAGGLLRLSDVGVGSTCGGNRDLSLAGGAQELSRVGRRLAADITACGAGSRSIRHLRRRSAQPCFAPERRAA